MIRNGTSIAMGFMPLMVFSLVPLAANLGRRFSSNGLIVKANKMGSNQIYIISTHIYINIKEHIT